MWFKKLIISLTIKILNKIKTINFGDLDKAINSLEEIIKKWDKIKK